jgi:hypothetical protein
MRFLKAFVPVWLIVCGLETLSFGSDGDSLTQRRQILCASNPDATRTLNAIINRHFELALEKVNRKDNPTRLDLEEAILEQVGDKKILGITIPKGTLETPIEKGYSKVLKINGEPICIPSFTIDRENSIYRDATLCESPGVVFGMASYFKMGGLVIGSDKLTHFFAQGYEYIEVERETGSTVQAIKDGIEMEKTKYGLSANGIYSYGDLSANYCGYCFWKHLTHPEQGYFQKCNGCWVQIRKFCWCRYVNPAWDEAINPPCGPAVERTKPYIAQLVRCNKIPQCPPMQTETLPSVRNFYPEWVLPYVLNPKTLAILNSSETVAPELAESEITSREPEAESLELVNME